MSAYDDMVGQLERRGFPRATAEAEVRSQYPDLAPESIAKSELSEEELEKAEEVEGDRVMLAIGFEAVRFSHPGRTKQTPGIADRRYYRRPRRIGRATMPDVGLGERTFEFHDGGITLWWEAKSETGRQRPDQREFQEMVEACGETYVLGTHRVLFAWLVANKLCRVEQDGTITPLTFQESRR